MTSKDPLVSIVLPSYNSGGLILGALRSLFKLEYSNYEIIVVDDCSTDGSIEQVEEKLDKNKKLVILNNNINLKVS